MKNRKKTGLLCQAVALTVPLSGTAAGTTAGATDWFATGAVATDYVQRGVSQTLGDAVVQCAINVVHDSGLWVGAFASNVDYIEDRFMFDDGVDVEVDYALGFGRDLNTTWSIDVALTFYRYPGARSFIDYDYRELRVAADYHGLVTGSVSYSDDYSGYYKGGFAANGPAVFYELSTSGPIAGGLSWNAAAGHADIDRVVGTNYQYWRLGLSIETGRFAFDAGWFASDGDGRRVYGDSEAGSRFVVGASVTLP